MKTLHVFFVVVILMTTGCASTQTSVFEPVRETAREVGTTARDVGQAAGETARAAGTAVEVYKTFRGSETAIEVINNFSTSDETPAIMTVYRGGKAKWREEAVAARQGGSAFLDVDQYFWSRDADPTIVITVSVGEGEEKRHVGTEVLTIPQYGFQPFYSGRFYFHGHYANYGKRDQTLVLVIESASTPRETLVRGSEIAPGAHGGYDRYGRSYRRGYGRYNDVRAQVRQTMQRVRRQVYQAAGY